MAADYYNMLGVSKDASADEIKRAYRRLARQLHPDVNPDPAVQERFKEVTSAYEVLSDPRKREIYDLGGDPLGGSGQAGGPTNFSFTDIMDAFFGQGTSERGPRSRVRRGQDRLIRLEVDLETAAFGGTEEVPVDTAAACPTCSGAGTADGSEMISCDMCQGRGEISHVQRSFLGQVMTTRPCPQCAGFGMVNPNPCSECAGDGRVRVRRDLSISVPPGVDTGTRLRLSGESEVGPGGGEPGDLYVEIVVRSHPVFTRDGEDLHATVEASMVSATLGDEVSIQTLDGERSVSIKPGTQYGDEVRLAGLGMPRLRGGGRGDIVVHVDVRIPTRLDGKQRALLQEFAALRSDAAPTVREVDAGGGFFSRIREAFRG